MAILAIFAYFKKINKKLMLYCKRTHNWMPTDNEEWGLRIRIWERSSVGTSLQDPLGIWLVACLGKKLALQVTYPKFHTLD